MKCPQCKKFTGVVDSRQIEEGETIRRRRKCSSCGYRFTTYENIRGADPNPYTKQEVKQALMAINVAREYLKDLVAASWPEENGG